MSNINEPISPSETVVQLYGEQGVSLSDTVKALHLLTGKGKDLIAEHAECSTHHVHNALKGKRTLRQNVKNGIIKTYGFDVLQRFEEAKAS